MSERKVLNKYYPPDFDPSKIPRLRLPKDRQYTVRLMAPCNMRCKTCGEYIYKGKKFNARKETVQNEEYLGIKIFRFYIKCPRCLAEITFKTDPQNADYIVEHGATRNFQALKLAEEQAEREAKEQEEEEKNNPMKLLENRTKASKQEMELLEALEELKDLNQRHAKVDFDHLLNQNHLQLVEQRKQQEDEDEAFIRSVFAKTDGGTTKRIIDDSDSENEETSVPKFKIKKEDPTDFLCESTSKAVKKEVWDKSIGSLGSTNKISGLIKIKKNANSDASKCSTSHVANPENASAQVQNNMPPVLSGGLGLLGAYSDSDQSSASD